MPVPSSGRIVTESGEWDVIWHLSARALEPEVCHCFPHGNELPCPLCDKKPVAQEVLP
jgi:hypothetical protein